LIGRGGGRNAEKGVVQKRGGWGFTTRPYWTRRRRKQGRPRLVENTLPEKGGGQKHGFLTVEKKKDKNKREKKKEGKRRAVPES